MEYQLYRLHFSAPVHFGNGSLEESGMTFCADSFFSALCQEALFCGGSALLEDLVSLSRGGNILFSDLFPFVKDSFWIPKPMMNVKREQEGDSVLKKSFKKLTYIPLDQVEVYGNGNLNPLEVAPLMKDIGRYQIQKRLHTRFPEESGGTKTMPYEVGLFRFQKDNGLYLVAGFSGTKEQELWEFLLQSLSFSGIGGKKSSGFGRFTWESQKSPLKFGETGSLYLSLSTCFPKDKELDSVLEGANYKIQKRAGFIDSATHSPTPRKKRDFYAFQSGSTFLRKFEGDIFDLSSKHGKHPVYSYQKPLFLGVNL